MWCASIEIEIDTSASALASTAGASARFAALADFGHLALMPLRKYLVSYDLVGIACAASLFLTANSTTAKTPTRCVWRRRSMSPPFGRWRQGHALGSLVQARKKDHAN
jgi:hypothetical protein